MFLREQFAPWVSALVTEFAGVDRLDLRHSCREGTLYLLNSPLKGATRLAQFKTICERRQGALALYLASGEPKTEVRFIDTPAQSVLGTGTDTNRLSTYEASNPRYGDLEEEGPWNITHRAGSSGDGVSYTLKEII